MKIKLTSRWIACSRCPDGGGREIKLIGRGRTTIWRRKNRASLAFFPPVFPLHSLRTRIRLNSLLIIWTPRTCYKFMYVLEWMLHRLWKKSQRHFQSLNRNVSGKYPHSEQNKQSKYGKLYFIEHSSEYLSIWIFYLNSHTNPLYLRPF